MKSLSRAIELVPDETTGSNEQVPCIHLSTVLTGDSVKTACLSYAMIWEKKM